MAPDPDDLTLVCVDCFETFVFTVGEQRYFAARGFGPPKRCKHCREVRRTEIERRATHAFTSWR